MNVDDRIAAIKRRIEAARLTKARSEVGKEAADKEVAEATAALRDQFGVDNQEQVRVKLTELQNDLNRKLEQVEKILDSHSL